MATDLHMPPTVTEVANAEGAAATLAAAAALTRAGGIALVRQWAIGNELPQSLGALGPVFEPVALPPDKEFGAATHIAESGVLASATSWHHDQSFATNPPTWSALLCDNPGQSPVPTYFCDGAALLSLLSPGFRSTLSTLTARHEAWYDLNVDPKDRPGHVHPVVIPVEGGVHALFVSPATVEVFDGWRLQESLPVLDRLFSMMNWPEVTVGHTWARGDLLIWPNRRYLHRTLPLDSGRRTRRLIRVVGHWWDGRQEDTSGSATESPSTA